MSKYPHYEIDDPGYPEATELYRAWLSTLDVQEPVARSLAYLAAVKEARETYGKHSKEHVASLYYLSEWFSHHKPRIGVDACLELLKVEREMEAIDSKEIAGTLKNLLLFLSRAWRVMSEEAMVEALGRFYAALATHVGGETGRIEETMGVWLYVGMYYQQSIHWVERGLALPDLDEGVKATLENVLKLAGEKIASRAPLSPPEYWEALFSGEWEEARKLGAKIGRPHELCVEAAELEQNFDAERMESLLDEWLKLLRTKGFEGWFSPDSYLEVDDRPIEVEDSAPKLADDLLLNTAICVREKTRAAFRNRLDLELARGLSDLEGVLKSLSAEVAVPVTPDHGALPLSEEHREGLLRALAKIRRRAEVLFEDSPWLQAEMVAEVSLRGLALPDVGDVGNRTVFVALKDLPNDVVVSEMAELDRFPGLIGLHVPGAGLDSEQLAGIAWEKFEGLRVLDLSENKLKELPEALIKNATLRWLSVAKNPGLPIDVDAVNLPRLLSLSAHGNKWSKHRNRLEGKLPQARLVL